MLYGYQIFIFRKKPHKPWLCVIVETLEREINREIGLGIILELITEPPYLKSLSGLFFFPSVEATGLSFL